MMLKALYWFKWTVVPLKELSESEQVPKQLPVVLHCLTYKNRVFLLLSRQMVIKTVTRNEPQTGFTDSLFKPYGAPPSALFTVSDLNMHSFVQPFFYYDSVIYSFILFFWCGNRLRQLGQTCFYQATDSTSSCGSPRCSQASCSCWDVLGPSQGLHPLGCARYNFSRRWPGVHPSNHFLSIQNSRVYIIAKISSGPSHPACLLFLLPAPFFPLEGAAGPCQPKVLKSKTASFLQQEERYSVCTGLNSDWTWLHWYINHWTFCLLCYLICLGNLNVHITDKQCTFSLFMCFLCVTVMLFALLLAKKKNILS